MDEELEKTLLAMDTVSAFSSQFGDDLYAEQLLLVLIEELLQSKDRDERTTK